MNKTIDARGLSCPQPVLMTLDAIKSGTEKEIHIIVDNEASRENVVRAAENLGLTISGIREDTEGTGITIKKG
jgi:TusA-related sulfurtransferase